MTPALIDRIYECSFLPELWPGVLADLAEIGDARGGVPAVMNSAAGIMRWTASESIEPLMASFVSGGWLMRGQRFAAVTGTDHAGFVTEHSSDEELRAQPMYRDFFIPNGLGWSAGTSIQLPTGDYLLMSIERTQERGRIEPEVIKRLDSLRPHLARSALMSARLRLEEARSIAETLARVSLPALVFDDDGKVLAVNPLMEARTDCLRWRARDGVALPDSRANAMLRQAMAATMEASAQVRSFAVRDADGNPAWIVHVIPIRRAARDIFAQSTGVMVMTPLTHSNAPPVELVRSLFDLTAAEARVARHLTSGQTVEEIAAANRVSINTVRTQVRGVLEKTGCRRQAEAVALLGGIVIPQT